MVLNLVEVGVGPQGIFKSLRALSTKLHTCKMGDYYSLAEKSLLTISEGLKPKKLLYFVSIC